MKMRLGKFLSSSALVAAAAVFLSAGVANAQNLANVTPLIKGCKGPQDGTVGTLNAVVCQACQGFCTVDSDCAGSLNCFHRNLLTPVPGCTCATGNCGAVDWDYCYSGPSTTHTPWVPPAQQPSPTPHLPTHQWTWNPPTTTPYHSNWSPPWNAAPTKAPTHGYPPWSHPSIFNPNTNGWNQPWPTWSNWSPPNTQPTPVSTNLYGSSAGGCGSGGCRECEGDCDSDRDCSGNLECFQRDGLGAVPGCGSGGMEAWDYCIKKSGTTPIKNIGRNGCNNRSCRLCEGDCDSDDDCRSGLRCFQRDGLERVPGCSGDGHGAWDYCISDP